MHLGCAPNPESLFHVHNHQQLPRNHMNSIVAIIVAKLVGVRCVDLMYTITFSVHKSSLLTLKQNICRKFVDVAYNGECACYARLCYVRPP
jgi:hypothetical protein